MSQLETPPTRPRRGFLMPRPTLPCYSSPENTEFHPVFKQAVKELLTAKGLTRAISIQGQFPSPTGPIDFVLLDSTTNKVILPIEIKRTQSSVRGQGRRQARDYWSNLGSQCQTPYYSVSNLELTELFRHDPARPRTSAQRIKLTHAQAGTLGITSENDFYTNLIACISEILDIISGSQTFSYATGLTQFQTNIESAVNNLTKWHQIFIPTCFEYIRGASSGNTNLRALTTGWRQADFYRSTPTRLIQLGKHVDFEHIFSDPVPIPCDPESFQYSVLLEAYESGKVLGNGDDIAELVNEALAPSGRGIVETDAELAQLMGIVAKAALSRELEASEKVMDPGSGSGRLLTALPNTAFPSLSPNQVWANEKEVRFAESLSLRLGLAFSQVISPTNAPKITISGIEQVDKSEFANVKLVVMNPPFMSGVQSASIKEKFLDRISAISGSPSYINDGQIALEALFLELVWNLVDNGTVIATIFPIQHLYRLSAEVAKLRQFLATQFALSHIVVYPSRGIFEGVTKQTVLLVGKKGNSDANVNFLEVQKQVGDIDFSHLYSGLMSGLSSPTHGVSATPLSREHLISSATDGWKSVIGAGQRVRSFINTYLSTYSTLKTLPSSCIRRGTVGNGGNTKLSVFNFHSPRYPGVTSQIPHSWLRPVLNTTDSMPRVLTPTNAPEMSFMPPLSAYQSGTADAQILRHIVDTYLAIPQTSNGVQARHVHSQDKVIRKLKSDQKNFGGGWVLIQRASRTKGEIGILEHEGILLSTNVPMVHLETPRERKLLASWLLSTFGQIQFEFYGTPQEGMRKLEMKSIKQVAYPNFSGIPTHIESALIGNLDSEPAINFSNIISRPSDLLWAEIVDPTNPSDCLNKALLLLQEIVDERRGFGNST